MKTYTSGNTITATGETYDMLLFNNATKTGYVYRSLYDSGGETSYLFNNFDIGDIPFGEYSYALLVNMGYRNYVFSDNILNTKVKVSGKPTRSINDYNPVLGILKYTEQEDIQEFYGPQYRDKDTEFIYYKKENN